MTNDIMTIDHKKLEYLAALGKIRVDKNEEAKLLQDLEKILAYFEQLKEVDTEGVEPLAGGTIDNNVFREDDSDADSRGFTPLDSFASNGSGAELRGKRGKLTKVFPEEENGFLKVPAVFE